MGTRSTWGQEVEDGGRGPSLSGCFCPTGNSDQPSTCSVLLSVLNPQSQAGRPRGHVGVVSVGPTDTFHQIGNHGAKSVDVTPVFTWRVLHQLCSVSNPPKRFQESCCKPDSFAKTPSTSPCAHTPGRYRLPSSLPAPHDLGRPVLVRPSVCPSAASTSPDCGLNERFTQCNRH